MQSIRLDDALVENVGCSGECHLLMIGYDKMKGIDWPVFWKKDPPIARLQDVWRSALMSGRGLDLSNRSLKLCVASSLCDLAAGALSKELLFAGYTAGSTTGSGALLLAIMLLRCKASPWQLQNVKAFLISIARIKVTFVVHQSATHRAADAWRLKASAQKVEEHHCLMAANMLIQSHAYDPLWTWTPETVRLAIQDVNNQVVSNPSAKIGSWKERSVNNIILFLSTEALDQIQASYQKWTWEGSYLTEDLMRQPQRIMWCVSPNIFTRSGAKGWRNCARSPSLLCAWTRIQT